MVNIIWWEMKIVSSHLGWCNLQLQQRDRKAHLLLVKRTAAVLVGGVECYTQCVRAGHAPREKPPEAMDHEQRDRRQEATDNKPPVERVRHGTVHVEHLGADCCVGVEVSYGLSAGLAKPLHELNVTLR